MTIRPSINENEKYDDPDVIETRRVVKLEFDRPSQTMKKRTSTKKKVSGGSQQRCTVYEIDMRA